MRFFLGLVTWFFSAALLFAIVGAAGAAVVLQQFSRDLPDFRELASYTPRETTRLHAGDGGLLAELYTERRLYAPLAEIPRPLIDAFISAEDKTFWTHEGIDIPGIAKAVYDYVQSRGGELRGASTITQQVVKNFLLNDRSQNVARKIREAILAYRIEQAFTKERTLEVYLNGIYLGYGAYGVAAAAQNYFDKTLSELTLAEMAFLALLPKEPTKFDPRTGSGLAEAIVRRRYVLDQMVENGYITAQEAAEAKTEAIRVVPARTAAFVRAPFFTEEVRRELVRQFGTDMAYGGGLSVRTTLNPRLQTIAEAAFREGLMAYDRRRRGWQGPVARIDAGEGWPARLAAVPVPPGGEGWTLALVQGAARAGGYDLGFADGSAGRMPTAKASWGAQVTLRGGDVVWVEPVPASDEGPAPPGTYQLRQIPEVEGGMVVLENRTGRVLAMVGGWSFTEGEFNRAVQALRQPGSTIKPFVFLAALEAGYTPNSPTLDAPITIGNWSPKNYSGSCGCTMTLRVALEKSVNLVTVRLARAIGMDRIVDLTSRYGVYPNRSLEPLLPSSLGAVETTVLRNTAGYAQFANGARRLTPTLIDRVQDRTGRTIWRHDQTGLRCHNCNGIGWVGQTVPEPVDFREIISDPRHAYQMVAILEGVVDRGTARRAVGPLPWVLAGKTGTTNDNRDAWFVGVSPDYAVGIYLGHDAPRNLREAGGTAAAPIFAAFMERALEGTPPVPFPVPPGVILTRVNPTSGQPVSTGGILEPFLPGTEPGADRPDDEGGWVYRSGRMESGEGDRGERAPPPPRRPAELQGTGGVY